jgi:hypothetical protein
MKIRLLLILFFLIPHFVNSQYITSFKVGMSNGVMNRGCTIPRFTAIIIISMQIRL